MTTGAYCNYNNNTNSFGKLYNWYAVNDPRGLAPAGFHVASHAEWTTLGNFLGGPNVAGGKLKVPGLDYWVSPNTGATNESNFSAYPSGLRSRLGPFYGMGYGAEWWTSTPDGDKVFDISLNCSSATLFFTSESKTNGFAVRCIKD
jgi:uncharacterized protein (TIGR02145 family)